MKKLFLILTIVSSYAFAVQNVEISYEQINQEFQAGLQQLFQNFANQQQAQGNEVVVTYYDNLGEVRTQVGTSGAPSYLQAVSNYKTVFMRSRQLESTKGVVYQGYLPPDLFP